MLELMYDTMTFDFSSTCSNMLADVVIRDQLRPMLSTNDKVTATIDTWRSKVTNLLTTINTSMNAV